MTIAEELTSHGYRRVSNKFGIVSRIDRPDWLEIMREAQPNWDGMPIGQIADFYRRVVSQDVLTVGPEVARFVPNSNHDSVGYI